MNESPESKENIQIIEQELLEKKLNNPYYTEEYLGRLAIGEDDDTKI